MNTVIMHNPMRDVRYCGVPRISKTGKGFVGPDTVKQRQTGDEAEDGVNNTRNEAKDGG